MKPEAVLLSTGSIPFMLFAASAFEEQDDDGNNPAYSYLGFSSPESEDNDPSAEDPGDSNALPLGASAGLFFTAPGIFTEEKLREILSADAGGVVMLGGDIEICDEVLDWYDIANPLVYHVVDPGKPYLAYAYSVYECGIEILFFSSIKQYDDIRGCSTGTASL